MDLLDEIRTSNFVPTLPIEFLEPIVAPIEPRRKALGNLCTMRPTQILRSGGDAPLGKYNKSVLYSQLPAGRLAARLFSIPFPFPVLRHSPRQFHESASDCLSALGSLETGGILVSGFHVDERLLYPPSGHRMERAIRDDRGCIFKDKEMGRQRGAGARSCRLI